MKGMITNMMKEYYISFKCKGSTHITAKSEEEAREIFNEQYVLDTEDIDDVEIDDVEISWEDEY